MIELETGDRGTGRTERLIQRAAKDDLYIVCLNHAECTRLAARARQEGVNIHFPLTYDEFTQQRFSSRGIRGFLIDNADQLLELMGKGVPIIAVSWETRPRS